MVYGFKVGDKVIIDDSKSTRHGKLGIVTYVGDIANWVKTDDGVDQPVWNCLDPTQKLILGDQNER